MKRRLLSALLAAAMMLTMTPAAFAADGDAVPAAAATALPEAEDGVITLTGPVNLTETQVFDTNTTIDLNGFDITATNCRALWQKSGTLTLTGKGTVRANKVGDTDWLSSSSVIRVGDGSDYTVESSSETAAGIVIDDEVTVSSTYCYGLSVFGGATKEIADISGTISAPNAIGTNGMDVKTAPTITLGKTAKVTASEGYAMYLPAAGTYNIAGTVEGPGGICLKAGKCDITVENGAVITATGEPGWNPDSVEIKDAKVGEKTYTWHHNSNGSATANYAVVIENNASYAGASKININGGEINGKVAVYNDYGPANNAKPIEQGKAGTITITGGTFTDDVSKYVADGYVQDENGAVVALTESTAAAKTADGTLHATLAKAVAAAKEGETVTLLRDATYNARINIDKNLTLDLGGKTLTSNTSHSFVVYTDKSFTVQNGTMKNNVGTAIFGLKSSKITLAKDATLDVYDGIVATNSMAAEGNAAVNIYGTINSTDVAVWSQPKNTFNLDGAKITSNYFGVYQNGSFGGNTFHIKNSTIADGSGSTTGIYISNSKTNTDETEQGYQTLTIENSKITGNTGIEVKFTNVTISGENTEITATGTPVDVTLNNNGSVTTGYALAITHNGTDTSKDAADGTITVENGKFSGVVGIQEPSADKTTEATMAIKNGHFTSAPDAAYLAEGKTLVKSTETGYNWMVADKQADAAEVLPADPEAKIELPEDASNDDEVLASSALSALTSGATAPSVDTNVMNAGASAVANANTTTKEQGLAELKKQGVVTDDSTTADKVTIVVQPYLDIKITGAEGDGNTKTLILDVTPMYQKVATTADLDSNGEIKVQKGADKVEGANAVILASGEMKITEPVTVTIPLPDSFAATNDAKIGHKGYVYTGTIDNNHVLTFVNPHGFSEIIIGAVVAATNETTGEEYSDLQKALDEAKNGETVIVKTKPEAGKTFTMGGDSREIKVKNGTGDKLTITINGEERKDVDNNDTFQVKYTRPSSGGGSSVPTYAVTADKAENGSVNVSPKNASKGATVTVTVKPDTGYELDTLTVTDKDGKEVKLTDKGDGKFTFEMPASKVTVKATFAKVGEQPGISFIDVATGSYYYDAVEWAVENGVTEGTSATTFSPDASCTRAQMVTFLWRANGSPKATVANPFTDVQADAYYYDAVLWAVEKGITSGTSATTFAPDATVTRGQTVTFLHRANGSPAVSGSSPFNDVAADAYYTAAVQWAVTEGVTSGTSATTFAPDAPCTRAQIVTFLYRDMA